MFNILVNVTASRFKLHFIGYPIMAVSNLVGLLLDGLLNMILKPLAPEIYDKVQYFFMGISLVMEKA